MNKQFDNFDFTKDISINLSKIDCVLPECIIFNEYFYDDRIDWAHVTDHTLEIIDELFRFKAYGQFTRNGEKIFHFQSIDIGNRFYSLYRKHYPHVNELALLNHHLKIDQIYNKEFAVIFNFQVVKDVAEQKYKEALEKYNQISNSLEFNEKRKKQIEYILKNNYLTQEERDKLKDDVYFNFDFNHEISKRVSSKKYSWEI